MNLIKRNTHTPTLDFFDGWDPLERLMRSMARRPFGSPLFEVRAEGGSSFSPPVDISQDKDEIVVMAELPGVKTDDVELTIHDDSLTIKGTKKSETESKEGRYQRVERRYGEFLRTFQLPTAVDPKKVRAEFKDGVLTIHMPVAEEAKPRQIEITAKN